MDGNGEGESIVARLEFSVKSVQKSPADWLVSRDASVAPASGFKAPSRNWIRISLLSKAPNDVVINVSGINLFDILYSNC